MFPEAKCYYDSDHVITRIGRRYYDITGEVKRGRHLYYSSKMDCELNRLKALKFPKPTPADSGMCMKNYSKNVQYEHSEHRQRSVGNTRPAKD